MSDPLRLKVSPPISSFRQPSPADIRLSRKPLSQMPSKEERTKFLDNLKRLVSTAKLNGKLSKDAGGKNNSGASEPAPRASSNCANKVEAKEQICEDTAVWQPSPADIRQSRNPLSPDTGKAAPASGRMKTQMPSKERTKFLHNHQKRLVSTAKLTGKLSKDAGGKNNSGASEPAPRASSNCANKVDIVTSIRSDESTPEELPPQPLPSPQPELFATRSESKVVKTATIHRLTQSQPSAMSVSAAAIESTQTVVTTTRVLEEKAETGCTDSPKHSTRHAKPTSLPIPALSRPTSLPTQPAPAESPLRLQANNQLPIHLNTKADSFVPRQLFTADKQPPPTLKPGAHKFKPPRVLPGFTQQQLTAKHVTEFVQQGVRRSNDEQAPDRYDVHSYAAAAPSSYQENYDKDAAAYEFAYSEGEKFVVYQEEVDPYHHPSVELPTDPKDFFPVATDLTSQLPHQGSIAYSAPDTGMEAGQPNLSAKAETFVPTNQPFYDFNLETIFEATEEFHALQVVEQQATLNAYPILASYSALTESTATPASFNTQASSFVPNSSHMYSDSTASTARDEVILTVQEKVPSSSGIVVPTTLRKSFNIRAESFLPAQQSEPSKPTMAVNPYSMSPVEDEVASAGTNLNLNTASFVPPAAPAAADAPAGPVYYGTNFVELEEAMQCGGSTETDLNLTKDEPHQHLQVWALGILG